MLNNNADRLNKNLFTYRPCLKLPLYNYFAFVSQMLRVIVTQQKQTQSSCIAKPLECIVG